jgi:hypothetical protein
MNITQKARDEIHDLLRGSGFGKVVAQEIAHGPLLDKIVDLVERHRGDRGTIATVHEAVQ